MIVPLNVFATKPSLMIPKSKDLLKLVVSTMYGEDPEGIRDSQRAHQKNPTNTNLLPPIHLHRPNTRIRQRKHRNVTQHVCNSEPQRQPFLWRARMAMMGVRAARERLHEHEDETPQSNSDNENVVEQAEHVVMVEDAAVKEEDAEFDAAVCEFLDY